MRSLRRGAIALGLTGAMALAAIPATAAPVASGAAQLKQAAVSDVTTVQYRRGYRHRGPHPGAVVGGIAAGIIGLAASQALAPRYYYDEPAYYYGAPGYYYDGPRYYRAPRYYSSPRSYREREYRQRRSYNP